MFIGNKKCRIYAACGVSQTPKNKTISEVMRMLMDTVKKKLGYMVRSERERRGLSQSRLAEQAGVSTRTISDIETCNGNPELATLIPIAQFLNISIDAAVQDERKEPDTTTYQIMKELQNCSEDERQIALRTLRGLLSALKEKDPLN